MTHSFALKWIVVELPIEDTTDGFVDMSIWLAFRDVVALVTAYEDVILDGQPSPAGTIVQLSDTAVVSSMTAVDGRVLIASSTLPYVRPSHFAVRGGGSAWKLCNLATNASVAVGSDGMAHWDTANESGSLLLFGAETPCHHAHQQ